MFPRPDPWEEQRRRQVAHDASRRRRRKRWILPPLILFVAAGAGVTAWLLLSDRGAERSAAPVTSVVRPSTTPAEVVPEPTVPPNRLIVVDEVWLLDAGAGIYDWGLNLVVPPNSPTRSGVDVTVRLLAADGATVATIERRLDGVNTLLPSTVAGRLRDPDVAPTRLEFDVAIGNASDDLSLDALLSTRAVDRLDGTLSGRIRSVADADIEDLAMVMIWRDGPNEDAESGVTGVVLYEVGVVRPGVDARFAIDIADEQVPDGLPDDIYWTRG